ncbi:hypothetical protein [Thermococcus stetteri]|uniref:hypothetical protein n=1 Tax=Thermococcus stetteri TaxID=49900 RepID=UPI001FD7B772|nr:hypothetical protein [Thermococcus stetteri]MBP1912830.1 hypothetical protein [Thermococcus stetteri]
MVLLKSGNSTTSLTVATAEDRNLTVPFFPGINAVLKNGPGYNGFSASFGETTLGTMHANTYPSGPMSLNTYTTSEECELCKLKAAMVGVVEGETCRLCCLESKNFGPAVVFAYYFHLIWDAIERYQCIVPWPPMPETNAVVTGASINSYASDIRNSLPRPGWGDLHPCLAPLDGMDPKDPANVCTMLECADVKFDCNCYMTCVTGPFKVWDAFVKCLGNRG